jgi:hypothetical protein
MSAISLWLLPDLLRYSAKFLAKTSLFPRELNCFHLLGFDAIIHHIRLKVKKKIKKFAFGG